MADDSDERKARTEHYLRSIGVPVNNHLPRIESEAETNLRSPEETAKRAIVLISIVGMAYGADRVQVSRWLKAEGIWDWVSPRETKIFDCSFLEPQMQIDASWRSENLYTLLWALKKVTEFHLPIKQCDSDVVMNAVPALGSSCTKFVNSADLRPKSEILYQTDLILRIHWAVRNAQLTGKDTPGKFIPGIVRERHYALNWLTCYEEEWDDITTDT